jgi:peptidoglycan hydrolase-like amidase
MTQYSTEETEGRGTEERNLLRQQGVPEKLTEMIGLRIKCAVLVSVLMLSSASVGAQRVKVSVFGLFHPRTVMVEASRPMLAKAAGREIVIEPGQRLVIGVAGAKVLVQRGETRLLGDRVEFASRNSGESEFTLAVPGKIRRVYRGQLAIVVSGRELVPVVSMELETAVASVNAAETAPGTPMEALKAQAVAIRSYLVAGGPRHPLSDFCDTTHCQFLKSPPAANSPAVQATEATRGLVLAWQGKPFAAMYSASCAGRTHSLSEIGYAQRDYPYFGVECEYCRRHPERWSATISEEDAATLLKKSDAERLRLARKLGWSTVQSNDYSTKAHEGVVDLSGVGRGHGLGLCERGGAAMASEGKNFREILEHYYPNTALISIEPSGDRAIVPSESRRASSH